MRALLGGLLAGVGGAALIAVLVLGRGESVGALTWETLDAESGVLWVHVESYERPPFKRVFNPRPERTIRATWTRVIPGSGPEWIGAGYTPDGALIGGQRRTASGGISGDTRDGEVRDWPTPRGDSVAKGDGSCDEINNQMEQLPSEPDGSFTCIEPYPRPTTGSSSSADHPAWPIDLDVASVRKEARFNGAGGLESVRFVASLEDGSEVLIGSERFHLSILPLRDWDYIEELVFGE